MKKILFKIIIVFAILVFSYLSGAKVASADDALIAPQCPDIVACGEEITIPIEITSSPEISSFGMDIVFPSEFTYKNNS